MQEISINSLEVKKININTTNNALIQTVSNEGDESKLDSEINNIMNKLGI